MKTPKLFLVLLLLAAVCVGLAPRVARGSVSFQFFYDSLDPYGDWLQVGDYGYCWRPSGVDDDWSPYSDGYWAYTDAGWTWVSYEDFGGITYHYGRWANVSGEGWCWVPGNEWGPAWVSWRNSDDYVGWAPLPPEAHWEPSVGFSVWVDNSYDIGPGYYNFCHSYDFGAPSLRHCLLPRGQNVTIIQNTVNITNITYNNVNRVVYNGGPNFNDVNRRSRRPVPALKLVQRKGMDNNVITQEGRRGGRGRSPLLRTAQQGNQLEVGAPDVDKPQDREALKPKKIAKVVDKEKVNKGWAGVKDPEERKRLKKTMQQQTANLTPETAPAKPVQVSDLQAVPEKADPNAPPRGVTAKGQGKGKDKDAASATIAAEKAGGRREATLPNDTAEKAQKERAGRNGQGADGAVADQGRAGKDRAKDKTNGSGVPQPAVLDPATATANTELDRANEKARARERREAVETRQDAERAAVQARRREAQVEAERDQVERAAARAQRQQEAIAAQENASRRENQRANALAERQRANALEERRQQSVENAVERRQQQIEMQRDQQRQQFARERQVDAQRQMQAQRNQQHHQQRALDAQRGAQQQRQAEAQRQMQVQRQQQHQAQAGGGGGGGGGGRGGKQQQADEEKAKRKK